MQDEELYKLFCGISNLESSIEAVRVIRDPHLNIGKGIAYVLFKTKVYSFPQTRSLKAFWFSFFFSAHFKIGSC